MSIAKYGTETKAYLLYDLEKKKIIFSRDVVFDETKNAIKEDNDPPKHESGIKFVQLDYLSDETVEKQSAPTGRRAKLTIEAFHTTTEGTRFLWRVTIAKTSSDPTSFQNALDRENKSQWINAMDKELGSLSANE